MTALGDTTVDRNSLEAKFETEKEQLLETIFDRTNEFDSRLKDTTNRLEDLESLNPSKLVLRVDCSEARHRCPPSFWYPSSSLPSC